MFNIISHLGNANLNRNSISLPIHQNGSNKIVIKPNAGEDVEKVADHNIASRDVTWYSHFAKLFGSAF